MPSSSCSLRSVAIGRSSSCEAVVAAAIGSSCTVVRMQPLIWDRRPDGLRAPAMICAFQGWNDAGEAASTAVSFLAGSLDASRFARLDPEEFYDFQANRPCVRFGDGERREIRWPSVEIFAAQAPRAPRDLVLVQGVEPS